MTAIASWTLVSFTPEEANASTQRVGVLGCVLGCELLVGARFIATGVRDAQELDQSAQPMTEADGVLVAVAASGGSSSALISRAARLTAAEHRSACPFRERDLRYHRVPDGDRSGRHGHAAGAARPPGARMRRATPGAMRPPGPADANADSTVAIDSGIDGASPPISDAAKDATPTGAAAPPASAVSFLGGSDSLQWARLSVPRQKLHSRRFPWTSTGAAWREDSAVDGPTVTGPDATTDASPARREHR